MASAKHAVVHDDSVKGGTGRSPGAVETITCRVWWGLICWSVFFLIAAPGVLIGPGLGERAFFLITAIAVAFPLIRTWRGVVELRPDELFVREMFFNRHLRWAAIKSATVKRADPAFDFLDWPVQCRVTVELQNGKVKPLDVTWSLKRSKARLDAIAQAINTRIGATAPDD